MSKESIKEATGAERRRYRRVPMAMRATLRGGELEAKPCIIRDFCPDGFFLSWRDEQGRSEIQAIKDSIQGRRFSVEFVVKYKGAGEKNYSVNFKIVRIFQSGMGVSFEEPDKKVLDILVKIGEVTEKKKQSAEHKDRETNKTKSGEYNKLPEGKLGLEQSLERILKYYFKKLTNRLLLSIKETTDENEKYEYFNAHGVFEDYVDSAVTNITKAIQGQFHKRPALNWEKAFENQDLSRSGTLSLVAEKEFETYLVLTGIVSDAEADHRLLLYRVTRKLSELYDSNYDEILNPIGFSRLFTTIDSYLQSKDLGYTALRLAYHQLEEVLLPDLIILYEELSEGIESSPQNRASKRPGTVHESSRLRRTSDKIEVPQQVQMYPGRGYPTGHNGNNIGVPVMAGAVPSFAPQSSEQITQTLMALKHSVGIPTSSHEMFQEQAGANETISVANQQQIITLLNRIQQEDNLKWKKGEMIGDIEGRLNPLFQNGGQQFGADVQNVFGLAEGVLDFLKEEQYLSSYARQDFQRMQAVLYKQAISEGGLFQDRSNPLRNIINLFEQLDMRGGSQQIEIRPAIDDIVERILSLESYDANSLENITNSLNELLERQSNLYQLRVQKVIDQCNQDQTLLQGFKKDNPDENRNRSKIPEPTGEYKVWQSHAKSMRRGDSLVIEGVAGERKLLSLAWIGPAYNQFIFVDNEGNKAVSMTQQELVIRLLKGTAELSDKDQKPLFDRAILSSLFGAYHDVNKQIIIDEETGLLNEEKYRTQLGLLLENARQDHVEHEFFYLSLSVAEDGEDNEKIINYLKHVAKLALEVFGQKSLIGRHGEHALGITSEFMSREGAFILAETLLKSLEDSDFILKDVRVHFPISIGISVINELATDIDQVVSLAIDACEKAKELGENQAWIHEEVSPSEDGQKVDSEHEVIDWQFWLEGYSQSEERIPLYGQRIVANKEEQAIKMLHIFPAMEDEEGVLRKPERFIKASSDHDLISAFEKRYIHNCLEWMSENKKKTLSKTRCLISLSAKTINSRGALDYVIKKLTECSVPPGKICFDVPGIFSEDEKLSVVRFIRTLREFGCRFSLGQFGVNGLSQEALKLPIDYICIDEILTSDVVESAQSYGLIKSLNDIAHMMEKQTVVSHEIDEDTLELLVEMNIDYITESEAEKAECLNSVSVESA